jgi:hypothetical protein
MPNPGWWDALWPDPKVLRDVGVKMSEATMRLSVSILAALVLGFVSAAHAAPISIRCADQFNKRAYFMTYDLEKKQVVFETPVGNIHRGEITSANDNDLEIVLHATGKVLFTLDLKRSVMYWPGFMAGELDRGYFHDVCKVVADRTVLVFFSPPSGNVDWSRREAKDAFSIRCPGPGVYYFVTMDRATRAVVYQMTQGSGMIGEIKDIAGPEIRFTLGPHEQIEVVWNSERRELTVKGVPGDPSRLTKTDTCDVVLVRSVMESYDRLPR